MAKKLSELTLATSIAAADSIYLVQGGVSKRGTARQARPSRFPFAVAATMGDSYMWQGIFNTTTDLGYGVISSITWARNYLKGRLHMPLENNLAVPGSYSQQIAATADAVIATGADVVFLNGGYNDYSGGQGHAAVLAYLLPGVAKLLNAGMDVIWMPIVPCTNNLDATKKREILYHNRLILELCSGQRPTLAASNGFPADRLPVCLDFSFMYDFTTGDNLDGYIHSDGTHLLGRSCFRFGYDQIGPMLEKLLPPRPTAFLGYDDIYNATNPLGSLLTNGTVNYGLMAGTGGSKFASTGVTPSGSVATGWKASRAVGSSTATMACSKEGTRADGLSGDGQVIQVDMTGAGVQGEVYRLEYVGSGFSLNSNLVVGKKAWFEATYEVLDAPTDFHTVQASLRESGSTPNVSGYDGRYISSTTATGPTRAYQGFLRTPAVPVQSTTTSLAVYLDIYMNGANGNGHAKVALRDAQVRYE